MEKPDFWIKKIPDPSRILMTPDEIRNLNDENLKRGDLYLCRVSDLKEEWTRDEVLDLLKEDWQGFRDSGEIRYDRNGNPLEEPFWSGLKTNLNQESLKEMNSMFLGLIIKRTDIRVFPTEECSLTTPGNNEFDRFQHSSISPGSLVGVYAISKDGVWAYVQTPFIRGWVRAAHIAIAKERRELTEYDEAIDRLVIIGNYVRVYKDPAFRKTLFLAQMGASFPLSSTTRSSKGTGRSYVVQIPIRGADGRLIIGKGYIPKGKEVQLGYLPYTQRNVARQAFKMLRESYGWGELHGGRDCSRFIMDLFNTFGIHMPRNSKFQAQIGTIPEEISGMSIQGKKRILDRAVPLATLLRLPGHIMLYLGKDHDKHYVIHSIWGVQRVDKFGPALEKIGKVVVSDLSLGSSSPSGSLLERITDIRYIGLEKR
jgi:hypothetical protein